MPKHSWLGLRVKASFNLNNSNRSVEISIFQSADVTVYQKNERSLQCQNHTTQVFKNMNALGRKARPRWWKTGETRNAGEKTVVRAGGSISGEGRNSTSKLQPDPRRPSIRSPVRQGAANLRHVIMAAQRVILAQTGCTKLHNAFSCPTFTPAVSRQLFGWAIAARTNAIYNTHNIFNRMMGLGFGLCCLGTLLHPCVIYCHVIFHSCAIFFVWMFEKVFPALRS